MASMPSASRRASTEAVVGALTAAVDGRDEPGIDELYVVYTQFVNSVTQTAVAVQVSPVKVDEVTATVEASAEDGPRPLYEFEPEAEQLIDFLVSARFQAELPLNLYVYPARTGVALPDAFTKYAVVPTDPLTIAPADIAAHRAAWQDEWTQVVLR